MITGTTGLNGTPRKLIDNTITKELVWKPKINLKKVLKSTYEIYKKNLYRVIFHKKLKLFKKFILKINNCNDKLLVESMILFFEIFNYWWVRIYWV